MDFVNLSDKPLVFKRSKKGLKKLVILPDYCPVRGALPVGIVAVYDRKKHEINPENLGEDVGCGMLLARFRKSPLEFLEQTTNDIAANLLENYEGIGSLGKGNHFITFYELNRSVDPKFSEGESFVLIHSGDRRKDKGIDITKLKGDEYIKAQKEFVYYAGENRRALLKKIIEISENEAEIILDKAHNSVEIRDNDVVYRKGAVKLAPGELSIIPSSMAGDSVVVRTNSSIRDLEFSLSHATGRKMSRSEAKANMFYLNGLPTKIYVPYFLSAENLASELPECYRDIEDVLPLIEGYAQPIAVLKPKSTIML